MGAPCREAVGLVLSVITALGLDLGVGLSLGRSLVPTLESGLGFADFKGTVNVLGIGVLGIGVLEVVPC